MSTELKYAFLCACQEAVFHQQELIPALAESLGIAPKEVFYHWVMPPRCEQTGMIAGAKWRYFFHGLECDLKHPDGRFIQVSFGPGGRFDTFSGWGVLQFIMTAKAPWQEFSELRAYLAEESPLLDELSGSHDRMMVLVSQLKDSGCIELADPALCTLRKEYTIIDADGKSVVSMPGDYGDPTKREFYDTSVCHRLVLSELGKQVLTTSYASFQVQDKHL